MSRLMLLVVLVLVPSMVLAEGSTRVVTHPCSISGVTLTSTAKAAASAATTLDGIEMTRTEQHSVAAAVTCTQTVSLTITAYGSLDGTNRTTCSPSVTSGALAFSATTKRLLAPLSLPVTPWVILTISSDATYPVTYTSVTLQSW